jgi:membrane protease YdiL (CAAX protease family)
VAAFVMAAVANGRRGPLDLLRRLVQWRVGGRWYAAATLLPLGVTALTAALNVLLGAERPQAADFADWYTFPVVLLITLFLKGPLTEEVAWRGFALPRLLDRAHPVVASLLLGGIWAFWHLPLLVSDSTGQRPALPFVVGLGAMSLLFTWIYRRTRGNLLLATLMHAMINTLAAFVFPLFQGATYERLWWIYAGVLWAAALAVLTLGRGLRAQPAGTAREGAGEA